MKKLLHVSEKFGFLVEDIYTECLGSGYTKDGAVGKMKYELLPMAKTQTEEAILLFHLSYFLAKENLKEAFSTVYNKNLFYMNNRELITLIAEYETIRFKQNEIKQYAKKIHLQD